MLSVFRRLLYVNTCCRKIKESHRQLIEISCRVGADRVELIADQMLNEKPIWLEQCGIIDNISHLT